MIKKPMVLLLFCAGMPVELIHHTSEKKSRKDSCFHAILFGVISDFLSGIAVTSGTASIITGLTILGRSTLQTVGTSVFVLSGLSLIGFLIHAYFGMVN